MLEQLSIGLLYMMIKDGPLLHKGININKKCNKN